MYFPAPMSGEEWDTTWDILNQALWKANYNFKIVKYIFKVQGILLEIFSHILQCTDQNNGLTFHA